MGAILKGECEKLKQIQTQGGKNGKKTVGILKKIAVILKSRGDFWKIKEQKL